MSNAPDPLNATADVETCPCSFHRHMRGEPYDEGAAAPLSHGQEVRRALHAAYLRAELAQDKHQAAVLACRLSILWQLLAIATAKSA